MAAISSSDQKPVRGRARAAAAMSGAPAAEAGLAEFADFVRLGPIAQSREIRLGLDAQIVGRVAAAILNTSVQSLLASLRIPSSTLTRKLAAGDRLSSGESDRVSRVILIHAHATDVFESRDLAAQWMQTPHAELDDEMPVAMLDTQTGYDEVQRILQRIEFGIGV